MEAAPMGHRFALPVLVLGISFIALNAQAQWQVDGVALSTAVNDQDYPTIVSDGAGGGIVTWQDKRSGTTNIYARRVNAAGFPLWTADGVALCTAANGQFHPTIVSDGAGGAIVTWEDYRSGNFDVYVQRVNALGAPLWTANGIALTTAALDHRYPTIVSDDVGGAIVTWHDYRGGASHIYAQRVSASGLPQWTADGIALCTAANEQANPTIASDDAGGAIVTWRDFRSGPLGYDIYAQRVNASGVPLWTVDGVALCTAANSQWRLMIISDGAGGAVVAWQDYRNGSDYDVYAQRVNAAGVPQWTADGVALCTAANDQWVPTIVSDGEGGAIVTWADFRSDYDVYAQRVNALGVPQWTADGVALCTAANNQAYPTIVSDGVGGAIVTWQDDRSDLYDDIYAQKVNASGVPQWTADGVALCTAGVEQHYPTIATDGAGGAIVTWGDNRTFPIYDIYAQHVTDPLNAVAIASFDASETNGVVTLRSAFRSDLGVEAVNVYRAVGTDADPLIVLERVNDIRDDRFEYVDRDVAPGQSYRYRIGVVDGDGEFFSPIVTVSVKVIAGKLEQNQPNPFNPTTTIRFVLPVREDVTLSIYDTNGHLVRTLLNEVQSYGAHEVTWDGRDDNGATMGSGVYFYRLRAGKLTESKKMVLLK
jgi:FlgD Ig-like domain